ncbi:MAG: chemotaxis response regulator protein-glutamate methylesterase [bacterium]
MSSEEKTDNRTIRVMVVEDSAYMRYVITQILESDSDIEVVEKARDGQEALEKLERMRPDVITLDIQMPRMDGLEFLRRNRLAHRIPTIVISSFTTEGAAETISALELGAIDFVPKPGGIHALTLDTVRDEVVAKVKMAARLKTVPAMLDHSAQVQKALKHEIAETLIKATRERKKTPIKKVIAIGCSTGGPRALTEIIPVLPDDIPAAVIIVQHMPPNFTRSLAERLNALSAIDVVEAANGQKLEAGTVYISPGDFHIRVVRNDIIFLSQDDLHHGVRPSADVLMESVARIYGSRAVGIVLTGMGSDGTSGLKAIRESGGIAIAEHESTSVVYGMPRAAVEAGVVDRVVPLYDIAEEILCIVHG